LIVELSAEMSYRIHLAVSQASHEQACVAEQDADDAELPPDDGEAPPGMVANDGAVGKVLWWLKAVFPRRMASCVFAAERMTSALCRSEKYDQVHILNSSRRRK
jgi:hypothetical protein